MGVTPVKKWLVNSALELTSSMGFSLPGIVTSDVTFGRVEPAKMKS